MPPADLVHEWGEVAGGARITIGHETALVASVGASARRSVAFTAPQAEHVVEEGYQRSATTTRPPAQVVLYSSCRRNSPMPTPAMWRARRRFFSMPATPEVVDHDRAVGPRESGGELV